LKKVIYGLNFSSPYANIITEQRNVILQTPMLLNALLSISLARNWLTPTLAVMRLHAFLAQALAPRNFAKKGLEIAQLPQIKADESSGDVKNLTEFADTLQSKGDSRVTDVNKALSRWPRVNVVDASFRGW
jgi:translocation protein SEC63